MTDSKHQIKDYIDNFPDDLLKIKIDKDKLGIEFPKLLKKFNTERKKKNNNSNEIDLFEKIFDDHFNSKYNSKVNILNNEVEVLLDQEVKETNPEKIELIKKEVSKINEIQNNLRNKFRGKLKFTKNYADKIYKTSNSITVNIENNKKQVITNTSIINFHGTTYDGHFVSKVNNHYLLVHISTAASQASSLGIWDSRINNWCFTHSDECFYPISFQYHDNDDTFSITSSCYYYGQDLIETKYLINKNRELIEIED